MRQATWWVSVIGLGTALVADPSLGRAQAPGSARPGGSRVPVTAVPAAAVPAGGSTVVEYEIPTPGAFSHDPAAEAEGRVWHTDQANSRIGRFDVPSAAPAVRP